MLKNNPHHFRKVLIENFHQLVPGGKLGHFEKIPDVSD